VAEAEFVEARVKCKGCGKPNVIRKPVEHPEGVLAVRWECSSCAAVHELSVSEEERTARALLDRPEVAGVRQVFGVDVGRSADQRR
jgi:hypothetical protein